MLGLKGSMSQLKGTSLQVKIRGLFREAKFAYQRAWRGYDDLDVISLYDRFNERMVATLQDFQKNNIGRWHKDGIDLSKKETDALIGEILMHFEKADIDSCIESGVSAKSGIPPTKESIQESIKIAMEHQNKALEMFQEWFYNLWI